MVTSAVALINFIVTGAAVETTAQPMPVRHTRATWLLAHEGDGAAWLITAVWVLPSEEDDITRGGGR
jgi:hypothetical protein